MSSVYFESKALEEVDDWLDESLPSGKASPAKEQHSLPQQGVKAGLGFSKTKATAAQGQRDELEQRLAKQAEKRRREQQLDVDNEDDEEDEGEELDNHHGRSVENLPLSKSKLMSKKESNYLATKLAEEKALQKQKKRAKQHEAPPAAPPPAPSQDETEQDSSPKKKGYWGAVKGAGAEGERKRTKTRSKQKNIRKDLRPSDQRPKYRPLSLETEKILESRDVNSSH
jgi:hypothetical protein